MKAPLTFLASLILMAGCTSSRVQLFERDSYFMTRDGDAIVRSNAPPFMLSRGIWLSKEAIEKLQREKIVP